MLIDVDRELRINLKKKKEEERLDDVGKKSN